MHPWRKSARYRVTKRPEDSTCATTLVGIGPAGHATPALDRPDAGNAFGPEMIVALTAALAGVETESAVGATPEAQIGLSAFLEKRKPFRVVRPPSQTTDRLRLG